MLVYALKHDVSIKEFSDGMIKMVISEKIHPDFVTNCHKILLETTGKNWIIETINGILGETIADKENMAIEREQRSVMEYPLVKVIMAEFKGAKIESMVRKIQESDSDSLNLETSNDLIFDEDN